MSDPIRVIYVDDDQSELETTAAYIDTLDAEIEVKTECEPRRVLDRLDDEPVDCLISDYKMPNLDGIELLSEVRSDFPELPFIFYTGHGSEDLASEAISHNATDYVRKSVEANDYELLINRIQAAVQRYRQELSYQELFTKLHVGIGVYEIDAYDPVEVNQAFCDLLGYEMGALLDLEFADLTAPVDGFTEEMAREQFCEAVESGTCDFEWPLDAENGDVVWADISLELAELRGGERILATVRDITERKEHEREIERQNQLFGHAQEIANVGVWEADLERETGWWSEEVSRIYGLPEEYEPDIGEGIEYFHPDDREQIEDVFERAIKKGEPYDIEVRLGDEGDDGLTWVRLLGKPTVEDGEVLRVRGTVQDVTEQKQREQRLQEIKERLDLAVEGANLGVWDWNMETDEVRVNEQWAEIINLEYESLETSISAWEELIHDDDLPDIMAGIEAHNTGDAELYDLEYRIKTGEDEWKWVQTMGRIVDRDSDGGPQRAVGIHMTIDERKRSEEQLRQQRNNLETLNEMVRHDIRNDLQLVLTYLEILESHVDSDGAEYLEMALDSANTAIDLTETARELAEAMLQADAETYPVNLRGSLHRQIENARGIDTNAIVTVEGSTPQVTVLANDMLDSVFRNVLQNAIQHNDKEVPQVTVDVHTTDSSVVVEIADNGPGVPDHLKDEIFAKGERGLESSGTGIGLYLTQTLLYQYDGTVWVEDNDPDGAIFCIELQRATT